MGEQSFGDLVARENERLEVEELHRQQQLVELERKSKRAAQLIEVNNQRDRSNEGTSPDLLVGQEGARLCLGFLEYMAELVPSYRFRPYSVGSLALKNVPYDARTGVRYPASGTSDKPALEAIKAEIEVFLCKDGLIRRRGKAVPQIDLDGTPKEIETGRLQLVDNSHMVICEGSRGTTSGWVSKFSLEFKGIGLNTLLIDYAVAAKNKMK